MNECEREGKMATESGSDRNGPDGPANHSQDDTDEQRRLQGLQTSESSFGSFHTVPTYLSVLGNEGIVEQAAAPDGDVMTAAGAENTTKVLVIGGKDGSQRTEAAAATAAAKAVADTQTRVKSVEEKEGDHISPVPLSNLGDSAPDVVVGVLPSASKQSEIRQEKRLLHSHTHALSGRAHYDMPLFKLEVMGLSSMYVMIIGMWILGLFNLIIEIILVGTFSSAKNPILGTYGPLFQAMFSIEGILRTFAATGLLFLLLTYPQRIIRHWISTYTIRPGQWFPYWNQGLIILMIFLMSITPSYSLYQVVAFWIDYDLRDDVLDVPVVGSATGGTVSLGVLSLLFSFSNTAIVFNAITSMIVLAFTFMLIGGVYHFQFQSAKTATEAIEQEHRMMKQQQSSKEQVSEADDEEGETRSERQTLLFAHRDRRKSTSSEDLLSEDDDDGEVRANKQMVKTPAYQQEIAALRAQSAMLDCAHRTYYKLKSCRTSYKRATGQVPITFQFMIVSYLVLLLSLSLAFEMNPSTVPLVSLVTMIRICSLNVTELLPTQSSEIIPNITIDGIVLYNVSVNYSVTSPIQNDDLGACSPSQDNRICFNRTVAVCVFVAMEIWLFWRIHRLEKKTHQFLKITSYARTRREILGFHFFKTIMRFCWTVILIGGFITAAVNPIESYVIDAGFIEYDNLTNTLNVKVDLDPMFQVGIGTGTMGFGSFFSMFLLWVMLLAFAYLPFDSAGFRGWILPGRKIKKGQEELVATIQREDFLLLVPREHEVIPLLELREREMRQGEETELSLVEGRPASMRKLRMLKGSFRSIDMLDPLVVQVRANVLVLETEILLFHFMHLSYVLAGKKLDPETKEKVSLKWEEQQLLVEDPRFKLEEHIIDLETDTHVMVFSSEDRIVVAFRGSVSLTNWQTDFNSSEVPCEYVKNVPPDLQDIPPTMTQRVRKVTSKVPLVHGGFVRAYESVRMRLTALCEQLLLGTRDIEGGVHGKPQSFSSSSQDGSARFSNQNRVLFVTGHSLGGGLAVLCAADLAVTLSLPHGRIAVTTWGAPKVGTYSFMARFNTVVRCARRFCMSNDIITKLPVDPIFQKFTLTGWWHCGTEILLNETGNMLIRPSPLERFMFSRTIGTPQAHLRMAYATALMVWVVRSHPDYDPDWWIGVVTLFYKNAQNRLKPVPPNLRSNLMRSLLKSGVTYTFQNRSVRDIMVDTTMAAPKVRRDSKRKADAETEDYSSLVTELLVQLRLGHREAFREQLQRILDLYDRDLLFSDREKEEQAKLSRAALKRKQRAALIETEDEDEEESLEEFIEEARQLQVSAMV